MKSIEDMRTFDEALTVVVAGWLSIIVYAVILGLAITACPGVDDEPQVTPDIGDCCACLYDTFPAVGEPCIYMSANACTERVKENSTQQVDTWAVCLADLCGDVCDGIGPFDVIGGSP